MPERELEVTVGDVFIVGDYTVTVVDVDGPEVSFRIEEASGSGEELALASPAARAARPR